MARPFILLDDARGHGAGEARLYRDPCAVVTARRAGEIGPALERIGRLRAEGHDLAGYLAYEAGLALEPRLAPLAGPRCGADGPLLWFGAFAGCQRLPAAGVPGWLAAESGGGAAALGPLEPQLSPGAYARAFARLRGAIAAGDIYQANLTLALAGSYHGDPLALYAMLRPAAAAGYGAVVFDGSRWLLSLSPELFFAARGDAVTVRPMKGTRPRGGNGAEDAALAAELAASPKERAENLMIVDLLRNDLARVSEPGSVRVENAFAVESYPTVHQMVTTVRARLRPGAGALEVLRALFPCGSITGAPKIRAMELIDRVERDARGPYCGAIGRIDAAGDAAFNVAIRTLRLTPGENGRGTAVLGVGSAIVADSAALPEWRECLVKGSFVRLSAGGCDLIETMRLVPGEGVALIEGHLARIGASAAELGFAFDPEPVRAAIAALCAGAQTPARLRLVAARAGHFALELGAMPAALPDPAPCAVLRLPVDSGDWRLRHKTSDRGFYEAGLRAARAAGASEALFLRDDGLVTEGCFTSLFVPRGGVLATPPARLGLLPGVLRGALIGSGRAVEAELTLDDLTGGFLIGNALRGLVPARLCG